MVLTLAPLPWLRGAAICLPAWLSSQSDQSGHQLPGCSVAPSSHWARLAGRLPSGRIQWVRLCWGGGVGRGFGGSLPSARIQWLRLRWAGGLMTPAIWPEAPITKRFLPGSTWVLAEAASIGTIWRSEETEV